MEAVTTAYQSVQILNGGKPDYTGLKRKKMFIFPLTTGILKQI